MTSSCADARCLSSSPCPACACPRYVSPLVKAESLKLAQAQAEISKLEERLKSETAQRNRIQVELQVVSDLASDYKALLEEE